MADPRRPLTFWESPIGWAARQVLLLVGGLFIGLLVLEGSLRLVPAVILWSRAIPSTPVAAGDTVVMVLGDSVPFGYGLNAGESWPAQLATALKDRPDVHVSDQAQPGALSEGVYEEQLPALNSLSPKVHAIVIVQVGHNDYAELGGFHRTPETARIPIPSQMPWWWNLRVARIVRWWGDAWRGSQLPTSLDEDAQERFIGVLRMIADATTQHGATPMLATYLIAGEAGRDLDPQDAIAVNELRRVQLDVNRLLRRAAKELGVPLLDLAWMLPAEPSWDPAMFIDGVHPTAKANKQIAAAVASTLFPK